MTEPFSPGPWDFCSCGCGFIGGGDDMIAKVTEGPWGDMGQDILTGEVSIVHHWGTVPAERAKANGFLIAAAPRMFAALDYARKLLSIHQIKSDGSIDAALSLARGEQA